jgi:hypothetical protein
MKQQRALSDQHQPTEVKDLESSETDEETQGRERKRLLMQ